MGFRLEDIYGYTHITTKEIARGGQGAVFRTQNPNIALKIEFDQTGLEFSKDLSGNDKINEIRLLPIPNKVNITLPQATLKDISGYVMTLLDDMDSFENVFDYKSSTNCEHSNEWLATFDEDNSEMANMLSQYIVTGGRRKRLLSFLKVAAYLSQMHARGLVYCDFSSKNAFVSECTENTEVWLIDADNLNYQEKTRYSGYYTPGFGAPEVVKGKGCTFYSDAYAFAIALFWQLTETHPFKGQLLEENFDDDFADDAEAKAFAGEYPWILDEDDDSNYLEPSFPADFIFSEKLMDCFSKTFSELGRKKRQTRPSMFEWANLLAYEFDNSVKCCHCAMDYDSNYDACPWCDTENEIIEVLSGGENDKWKFTHEIIEKEVIYVPMRIVNGYKAAEVSTIAFTIQTEGGYIYLSNTNENYEWSVKSADGDWVDIYGRARIIPNCNIRAINKFSRSVMEIEVNMK